MKATVSLQSATGFIEIMAPGPQGIQGEAGDMNIYVAMAAEVAASVDSAAAAASDAAGSATAAELSATNAANSATAAAASADTATTQAGIATTKADEAASSATGAATSATNAATSATAADTSATNAATSATAAASSASTAVLAKNAAAASATAAGISQTGASTSATAANASKNLAAGFVVDASEWATKTSEEVIPGMGYGAKKYALDAAASADTAATKASEAATSVTAAAASVTDAAASASGASTSAAQAADSAAAAAISAATAILWSTAAGAFTPTPASTNTITMVTDLTAAVFVGTPLKYIISGVTYYGVVTAITANLLTLRGAPLSGDLTDLFYGPAVRVEQLDIVINGYYEDAANTALIASDIGTQLIWRKAKAYCVGYSVFSKLHDTGATHGKATVLINGTELNTVAGGLTVAADATWYSTLVDIAIAAYDINYGEAIEISVTKGTNGDATDLTVSLVFVMP